MKGALGNLILEGAIFYKEFLFSKPANSEQRDNDLEYF